MARSGLGHTFTQEDPIGLAGGLNLYGFAGGDPVNFADPFGLQCQDADGNEMPCPDQDPARLLPKVRPMGGRFAGAAARALTLDVGRHIEVGLGATTGNRGFSVQSNEFGGTDIANSVVVSTPALGASVDVTVKMHLTDAVWSVNVGANRHLSVGVSNEGLTVSIGYAIGGTQVSGSLGVSEGGGPPVTLTTPADATAVRLP